MGVRHLTDDQYRQALELLPIATVDFVIVSGQKFLLGKRRNRPVKGCWWIPGGRVYKGERQVTAIKRKLKQETGLLLKKAKLCGVVDTIFPDSSFGPSTHSISIVYRIEVIDLSALVRDNQHDEFRWFSEVNPRWHPALRNQLATAGFK